MRLFLRALLGGLLIVGLFAGCTKKPIDDGSGPRATLPSMTKKNYNGKVDWTVNLALG